MSAALITEAELAELLAITPEEVARYRRQFAWPCHKFGRWNVRYDEAQVEQIKAKHLVRPVAKAESPLVELTERSRKRSA